MTSTKLQGTKSTHKTSCISILLAKDNPKNEINNSVYNSFKKNETLTNTFNKRSAKFILWKPHNTTERNERKSK